MPREQTRNSEAGSTAVANPPARRVARTRPVDGAELQLNGASDETGVTEESGLDGANPEDSLDTAGTEDETRLADDLEADLDGEEKSSSDGASGGSRGRGNVQVTASGRPFLETLQRAKEGDLKAFEEIFQLYHRRIYNAVYGMLNDPDDAQDVTQDVFMRLHDALPTLRADEAFSTYLYRIALNLCRDRARRKKRVRFQSMDTPRTDEEGGSEPMDFPDMGKLPEELITNEELQKRVRQAVGTLSPDHKSVIVMHHFQGMEVNDIARILGVPTGTVKSRLARGRDQLHRKLRSYLKA